jgi:hypothetical protein
MKKLFPGKYFLPFCLVLLLLRCGQPVIPAYIYADTFTFTCDLTTQGYDSEKITDGWLYVNGELLGVYELPALIPLLASGNAEIVLLPGVKENGISVFSISYPFYDAYEINEALAEGVTDTLHPLTSYFTSGLHYVIDRFEIGNMFSPAINSDTSFTAVTDAENVFEGLRSMQATLDGSNYFFRVQTDTLSIPDDGRQCFFE